MLEAWTSAATRHIHDHLAVECRDLASQAQRAALAFGVSDVTARAATATFDALAEALRSAAHEVTPWQ